MIDVIMVVFNPPEKTIESIYSLLANSQGMNRLILVDNASKNKTNVLRIAGLADLHLTLKTQTSLSGAWNAGMSYANTDYAVITNDDVLSTENWLISLKNNLDKNSEIGILQPKNTLGEKPENFPNNYQKIKKVGDIPKGDFYGCCFAIRRRSYNELKLYDRRWNDGNEYTWFYEKFFPIGAEDKDFYRRVKEIGYTYQTDFNS